MAKKKTTKAKKAARSTRSSSSKSSRSNYEMSVLLFAALAILVLFAILYPHFRSAFNYYNNVGTDKPASELYMMEK